MCSLHCVCTFAHPRIVVVRVDQVVCHHQHAYQQHWAAQLRKGGTPCPRLDEQLPLDQCLHRERQDIVASLLAGHAGISTWGCCFAASPILPQTCIRTLSCNTPRAQPEANPVETSSSDMLQTAGQSRSDAVTHVAFALPQAPATCHLHIR